MQSLRQWPPNFLMAAKISRCIYGTEKLGDPVFVIDFVGEVGQHLASNLRGDQYSCSTRHTVSRGPSFYITTLLIT